MSSNAVDILAVIGLAFSVALGAGSAMQIASQVANTTAKDNPAALRCVPKQPSDMTRNNLQPHRPAPCHV
jgi:hypothetical protein